ncbi:hypothetical protein SAMN05444411_102332 [Lutibacter oricola]|uniref:Methyltransferase domain-containing protein n=1 Tax=Lutibacter oricola TaxID=762486 RepID=A0A1H2X044_9FLAO|nr:hypothetical protein [Lutibacter oricola]SDW86222.1 hypothetical protein SAMN05444411_102332 [Lutibacter oricola]
MKFIYKFLKKINSNLGKGYSLSKKTKEIIKRKESDYDRWSNNLSLHKNWNERTELISKLLPDQCNIIEFGAGNMYLKKVLKSKQAYTPSDLVKRFSETVVCDLNKKLELDLGKYDVIVFSGVLEYVYDIEKLFVQFPENIKYIILSFADSINNPKRLENGWLNNYSKRDLLSVISNLRYEVVKELDWNNQVILKLRRLNEL